MSTLIATTEHQDGAALVDSMTPVHLVLGLFAGALGVDPKVAVAAFIGARILDTAMRQGAHHAFFGREEAQSLGNELGDVLALMMGATLGHHLRDQAEENSAAAAGVGTYLSEPARGLRSRDDDHQHVSAASIRGIPWPHQ